MKKLTLTLILAVAAASVALGNENVVVVNAATKPVPVTSVAKIGTTALTTTTAYAAHITTNATTTATAATAYITSVVVSTTAIGTTEVLKIQDKSGTPKIIYQVGSPLVLGTVTPINGTAPLLMTGGIDIITSGTTAGTVDVWITFSQ